MNAREIIAVAVLLAVTALGLVGLVELMQFPAPPRLG